MALTFHHLIPRKVHRRPRFRKRYDKAALAAGIMICRACHAGIHRFYDEMKLARELNSLEALMADEALARHFAWVARQRTANEDDLRDRTLMDKTLSNKTLLDKTLLKKTRKRI